MKYYLFDFEHNWQATAKDIKTALQVFGEMYDESPENRKDWTVEIYLEIKPKVEKFYNVYYLSDFLNKSPEFFEATPEQEDEHAEKQKAAYFVTTGRRNGKTMTAEEIKAFNAGNTRAINEMAQGFTDEEYKAVLQYIPTGFIIGEIARRFEEYHNATNEILSTINNMKLFQNDDKKGN